MNVSWLVSLQLVKWQNELSWYFQEYSYAKLSLANRFCSNIERILRLLNSEECCSRKAILRSNNDCRLSIEISLESFADAATTMRALENCLTVVSLSSTDRGDVFDLRLRYTVDVCGDELVGYAIVDNSKLQYSLYAVVHASCYLEFHHSTNSCQ